MKVKRIVTGFIRENCYVVYNDNAKRCAVIDPGEDYKKISDYLIDNGLIADAVLLTHGHFDHIGAVKSFQDLGACVYINAADDGMTHAVTSGGFPTYEKYVEQFIADKYFVDGQTLKIAGLSIEVIFTPGHTRGGTCFKIANCLFTGDTLFHLSVGRTDLEGGDFETLLTSIQTKLFCFSGLTVYPGHEESSDIDTEKTANPYFKGEGDYDKI